MPDQSRPTPGGSAPGTPESRRRVALLLLALVVLVAVVVGVVLAVRADPGTPDAASTDGRGTEAARTPTTSTSRRVEPSGTTSPSPVPVAQRPRRSGVTFGSALYALSADDIDDALDAVVDLHMGWIRIDLSWAAVQPLSRSRFDWSAVDTVVDAARARDLQVLGLLTYTPPWARAAGCRSFACPPRSAAEFADFAAAAAGRYGPDRIGSYQIWNEPNLDLFWRGPDPSAYGRLLDASVSAVRAAADGVRILFGGLAFTGSAGTDDNGDIGPARFLTRACLDHHCRVDAVGYDPYTYPGSPADRTTPANAWQGELVSARSALRVAMNLVGIGPKAIWVTGFGAPTDYPGASSDRVVSPARQSRILLDGLRLAGAHRDLVGAYFVDTLRDARARGGLRDHFGLIAADGTRKPAFRALATALKR